MFGWRSARGRAVLLGAVFVLLLAAVVALAVWRAHDDENRHSSLQRRSTVVSALDDARAQSYLAAASAAIAAVADDPSPFYDLYRQVTQATQEDLDQARAVLISLGSKEQLDAVGELNKQRQQLAQEMDTLWVSSLSADRSARVETAQEQLPRLWPLAETFILGLEQLAKGQQAELAAERAAANRAADVTLTLFVAFGLIALVAGTTAMVMLILSVVRPLASLRKSVRAITSGDLAARAKVSGPEEVASLARDFNEMVSARGLAEYSLRDRTEVLAERAKELNCLYNLSDLAQKRDVSLPQMLQATTELLPPAWQYPEVTCARIVFEEQVFTTDNFRETRWSQASEIVVRGRPSGTVEVRYLDGKPEHEEGPFLDAERRLINAVAERLGHIIERKQAEEALQESEARYKALFAGAPEGMLVADLQTRQFRHANPAMCRMFGYTEEEFLRIGVADIHPKESLDYVLAEFEAQVRGEKLLSPDLPCQRKDGSLFYANVSGVTVVLDGRKCNVGIFTDVTERRQMVEALREQARRDPMTGVLNHGAIVDELRNLLHGHHDSDSHTVAMVDVDGLKATNDIYGHQIGDAVLVAVAGALSRDGAVVGRYGGDEFVAILPGANRQEAERYQATVLETLASAGLTDPEMNSTVPVAVSIGLAIYPTEAARVEELISLADSEMYAAKRQRPEVLTGRANELNCLYALSDLAQKRDVSLPQMLQATTELLPPAWQYPEVACARIVFEEQVFTTDNFRETKWSQASDIVVRGRPSGTVEVHYLDEKPERKERPFLDAERRLINAVAERLGHIIEQRQAEQALRESEERFRLAINATEEGLWEWDIQTNQEFFSPRWCEIIGYSFDDPALPHTYTSWASRIHPDDYDRVVTAMNNHLEKGTRYDVDYRHRHKSGEYRWQNSKGQAVLDESGKPIRMVGCISDITDRKRAEEALRESEARYKALFAGAPEGMLVADLQTKQFRHANPAMCRMFGYTEEEFLRIGVADIHPKESLDYVLAEFEAQARGEKLLSADLPCQRKDGSLFYADVNAIMVVLDGRKCNVGFFTDVTERKQMADTQDTAIARTAALLEELRSASARLAQSHTETVMLLAAAAEAHDSTTGLHLQNVRAISEALAHELDYGEEEAKDLGLAAVLHDIGKVRVPDSLLASTGTLANEEWELMKHHTTWGGEFLAGRPGFELAATIARSHHERWDGGGYPDGLAGEAIPEAATIVAAADAFDAITSDRPYRAARSVAAAIREIVACSGGQFSPKVVEALVRLHKRNMLRRLLRYAPEEKAAA